MGGVDFITTSVEDGLMLPANPLVKLLIYASLFRAHLIFPELSLSHFLFNGTHAHFFLRCFNLEDIPGFMERFKAESSHYLNRVLGRQKRTTLWDGYGCSRMIDPESEVKTLMFLFVVSDTPSMKNVSNSKAFTLIELLVVMAIISVISAMGVAQVNEYRSKANDVAAMQAVVDIRLAQEAKFVDEDRYATCSIREDSNNCSQTLPGITNGYSPDIRLRAHIGSVAAGNDNDQVYSVYGCSERGTKTSELHSFNMGGQTFSWAMIKRKTYYYSSEGGVIDSRVIFNAC